MRRFSRIRACSQLLWVLAGLSLRSGAGRIHPQMVTQSRNRSDQVGSLGLIAWIQLHPPAATAILWTIPSAPQTPRQKSMRGTLRYQSESKAGHDRPGLTERYLSDGNG